MTRGMRGRADLLRVLGHQNPALTTAMAALLDYHEIPLPAPVETPASSPATQSSAASSPTLPDAPYIPADVPFWRLETYEALIQDATPLAPPTTRSATDPVWRRRPQYTPAFTPLAPRRLIRTRLRQVAALRRATADLDLEAAVERLSRGELLREVPHRTRRAWGPALHIIEDRARRLVPYWRDQDDVTDMLQQMYPPDGVTIARLGDGDSQPMLRWPAARRGEVGLPAPHTLVLVLGDLGCLATRGEPLQRFWRHWGRLLHDNHNPAVALVPMPLQDIPPELARLWTVVRWDAGAAAGAAGPAASTTETVQQLLTLLAPAVRLEPGLLRAVRGLLPAGSRDAGLEARVWQDAALRSQHSVAATPDPEQRKAALARFAAEPEPLRRQVLEYIRAWRAQVDEFVWFEEVLDLEPEVQRTSVAAMDLDDAQRAMQALTATLQQPGAGSTATRAWASRFLQRWPDTPGHSRGVQQAVHVLYELVRPYLDETQVPQWYDPALRATVPQAVRRVAVWQVGDQVRLQVVDPAASPESAALTRGSPLGLLHSSGEVILAPGPAPERPAAFWQAGQAPAWAHEWGYDAYGAWVTLRIGAVVQRMRWIAPGRFRMGSPPEEAGRWDDEGPRHTVQLTQGFWLFDTPCTQALWQAVMGENLSHFQGAQRPVERVSWDDCQRFLQRLHAVLPGLELSLPTEAQWEYACRAGTETPRYAEGLVPQLGSVENHPLGAPGSSPAPAATLEHGAPRRTTQLSSVEALDAIAWYAGNSHGETHDVGTRRPNAWGLYDMLGNVYEWCHDGRRAYAEGTVRDPLGPTTAGAGRALRGGSWADAARLVRAALRFGPHPGNRDAYLGFRAASSKVSQPAGARATWSASRRWAEPAPTATRRPAAQRHDLRQQPGVMMTLPESAGFVLHTDRERLHFGRVTRPAWATEIGRDAYGLWAMCAVKSVQQRLRWIPPGCFLMGSPQNEEGRFNDEGPQHEVQLTRGFWLFETPCPQALWQAVMGRNPSQFKGAQRPVEQVSWEECQRFCERLKTQLGLAWALPTEAQWEYACRAGTETARYAAELDAIAWHSGNSDDTTHAVGQKRPNAWGLYDMLGNVWEWCHDGLRTYEAGTVRDPVGPTVAGAARALRGGGWGDAARVVRAADRFGPPPRRPRCRRGLPCRECRHSRAGIGGGRRARIER